mmetsp:Transcript_24005/g.55999  ORF Transcript_24005/g.55999 Transcript_24005/m.55999 type:complete len:257 (-) Transcript_24005:367-1137(-)
MFVGPEQMNLLLIVLMIQEGYLGLLDIPLTQHGDDSVVDPTELSFRQLGHGRNDHGRVGLQMFFFGGPWNRTHIVLRQPLQHQLGWCVGVLFGSHASAHRPQQFQRVGCFLVVAKDPIHDIVRLKMNSVCIAILDQMRIKHKVPNIVLKNGGGDPSHRFELTQFFQTKVGDPDTLHGWEVLTQMDLTQHNVFQGSPRFLPSLIFEEVRRWASILDVLGKSRLLLFAFHPWDFIVTTWPMYQDMNSNDIMIRPHGLQ